MKIKPDDPEISIPSRTAFSDSNSYNSGHYGQMIDESLSTKHTHWIEACDKKYACQPHTCVYSCGRSGCTQTVSSSTQHSATCASGHSYWTCKSSDVSLHKTRTCRKCSKSWERCSTVGGTPLCDDPWRRSRGLPCWKKE